MLEVRSPTTGKVYTYASKNRQKAEDLAARLGVRVVDAARTICVCGEPEDSHEAIDCQRDYRMAPWPLGSHRRGARTTR